MTSRPMSATNHTLMTPSPAKASSLEPTSVPSESQEIDISLLFDASPPPPQWHQHVQYYIAAVYHRLARLHPGAKIRFALITYSRATSTSSVVRSSPILAQLPFSPLETIFAEFKNHSVELGIGRATSAGGSAVLEAIVAALEMFDNVLSMPRFKNMTPLHTNKASRTRASRPPKPIFHIVVFSHSPPNILTPSAWNRSRNLDDITWSHIPDEIRKRKVHLNVVLLVPSPALSELHARTVDHPDKPWFPLPEKHSLLFSSSTAKLGSATNSKRPHSAVGDVQTVGTPGTQRGPETPSPNKRLKFNSPIGSSRAPPGQLNIPPFDMKQIDRISSSQPALQPPTQSQPAAIQRHHQRPSSPPKDLHTPKVSLPSAPAGSEAQVPTEAPVPATSPQKGQSHGVLLNQAVPGSGPQRQPNRSTSGTQNPPNPAQILIASTHLQKSQFQGPSVQSGLSHQAQTQPSKLSPRTPLVSNATPRPKTSPNATQFSPPSGNPNSNARVTSTPVTSNLSSTSPNTLASQAPNSANPVPQPLSNTAQMQQFQALAQQGQRSAAGPLALTVEQRRILEQNQRISTGLGGNANQIQTAAMHQLLQQQQRAHLQRIQGNALAAAAAGAQGAGISQGPIQPIQPAHQAPASTRRSGNKWSGTMTWTAQDPNTRLPQEITMWLLARPAQGSEVGAKIDSWPATLAMNVAALQFNNFPELQAIIKSRNIPVCAFFPTPQIPDVIPSNNEKVYMGLYSMLSSRNCVASIPVQFQGQPAGRGMILFPLPVGAAEPSAKIFAAIFVDHDLPRLSSPAAPNNSGSNLVPPSTSQVSSQQTQANSQAGSSVTSGPGINTGSSSGGPQNPQQLQQLQSLYLAQRARARSTTQNPPPMAPVAPAAHQAQSLGLGLGLHTGATTNALGFSPGPQMFGIPNANGNPPGANDLAAQIQAAQLRQQQNFLGNAGRPTPFMNMGGVQIGNGMNPQRSLPQAAAAAGHNRIPTSGGVPPNVSVPAGNNPAVLPAGISYEMLQAYLAQQQQKGVGPR